MQGLDKKLVMLNKQIQEDERISSNPIVKVVYGDPVTFLSQLPKDSHIHHSKMWSSRKRISVENLGHVVQQMNAKDTVPLLWKFLQKVNVIQGWDPPVFWYLSTDSQSGWGWKGPRLCLVPLPKLCLLRMRQTCCRKPLHISSPLQSRHAVSPVYSRICWMFFGFTPHESVRTPNGSMPHPAKPEERPRALLPKHEQQNQTGKEQ